jgi:precorrin-2 dehydrogenase/sirohydrochlorin ferrochelatase
MKYYPVFFDVNGRRCVVIGGGDVAQRKVDTLLKAGAWVEVISPCITEKMAQWEREGRIRYLSREYKNGDLKGAFLVIAATDSKETNSQVALECRCSNIPVNVVDDPDRCTFILPSIVERGDLIIAISTSGASPALSKRIREELEKVYGEEYSQFLLILRKIRRLIISDPDRYLSMEYMLNRLMESGILQSLRERDSKRVSEILESLLGADFRIEEIWDKSFQFK